MLNTTLCYIEKDSSYLMLHRIKKQNDYNRDKWIGIGGKFEDAESPEECAVREIKEETGLFVEKTSLRYCGIVTFVDIRSPSVSGCAEEVFTEFMHIFWTDKFSGKMFTSEQCTEGDLEWVPISKMNSLPHWEGDEIFLDMIAKRSPFFSLKLVYKNGVLLKAVLNGKTIKS